MVRRADGRPWFIHGVGFDVTELKQTEAELQQARDELERRVLERTEELARTNADLRIEIVERRRVEEERAELLAREQEARKAAEAANRLKDDFLTTVSHELRTPLTAIVGWTEMLREGALDAVSTERALQTIERNAKAQVNLVNDLLDASRIVTGKLQLEVRPVELITIVEAAVDTLRPAVEAKEIRLQMVLQPWVGPFSGDQSRLQQIISNLISNAIKFTPPDGLIEVRLEKRGQQAFITVKDTGRGISPEFLPHVFDRFRQADGSTTRAHGGLGLGLAIVKSLVEMHGGTIQADSSGEGQGASFVVALPLTRPRSQAASNDRVTIRTQQSSLLNGVRVLVVDDEADAREVLGVMLRRCSADVRIAASVAEAFALLPQWRPDVLVSDIGMPGEDGYALIRKLRLLPPEQGGRIPALALTAHASTQDRDRALAAGYQNHLAKPIKGAMLASAVAALVSRVEEDPDSILEL
jgi:signal transduction histidine kinase/ActR/RegA family two-component response regulator